MSALAPLYALWTDDLVSAAASTVTLSNGVAVDAIATWRTGNPAAPYIFTAKTLQITIDLGSAIKAPLPVVIQHNLDPAISVLWRGNSSNSWPGSTNPALTIGALEPDGYRPNVYYDEDVAGAAPALRWRRFDVAGTNTNNIQIGTFFVSAVRRQFPRGFVLSSSPEFGPDVDVIEHLTYGNVSLRVNKGFRREQIKGSLRGSEADCDTLLDVFRAMGGSGLPIVLVPNPNKPQVHLVLLDQGTIRKRIVDEGVFEVAVAFRELSRGLVLT